MTTDQGLRFDGKTYEAPHDQARLSRQLAAVWKIMSDGQWRTLTDLKEATGEAHAASVSARLRDFRKARFGSHTIERRARGERSRGLFEYRLVINNPGATNG